VFSEKENGFRAFAFDFVLKSGEQDVVWLDQALCSKLSTSSGPFASEIAKVTTQENGIMKLADDSQWHLVIPSMRATGMDEILDSVFSSNPDMLLRFPDFVPLEGVDLEGGLHSTFLLAFLYDLGGCVIFQCQTARLLTFSNEI
jgi:hypothetical protein